MGFSRQEYWSRLPYPSPGDLPNPGIKPRSPALQADALPSEKLRESQLSGPEWGVFWLDCSPFPQYGIHIHTFVGLHKLFSHVLIIPILPSSLKTSYWHFKFQLMCHLLYEAFPQVLPVQFSSVQSISCVRLFATPWIASRQASLSITISQSSLKLMSIESVMPSSHLILCRVKLGTYEDIHCNFV